MAGMAGGPGGERRMHPPLFVGGVLWALRSYRMEFRLRLVMKVPHNRLGLRIEGVSGIRGVSVSTG